MSNMLSSIDCEEFSPLEPGSGERRVRGGARPWEEEDTEKQFAQPSHGMLAFQIANTMTQREGIAG